MKIFTSLLLIITLSFSLSSFAQEGIDYGENFIVFEAEATSSPLTKWTLKTPDDSDYQKYVTIPTGVEPINDTYLEYSGPWLGGTDTELEYKFTCKKSGKYRMLIRMHQPLREGEKGDQRNDVFVRLHGNYTSETQKPKSELEKNHKFWGRGVNKWGSCHKLEIGNHMNAVYGFTEGEDYTFVVSGRSGGTCIDYILFYEISSFGEISQGGDVAIFFPENMRPGLGLVDPTYLQINPSNVELREGTTLQLGTTWEPENAKKDVQWSSSDTTIVTVNENGIITAKGVIGQTASITATSSIVDSISTTCTVSIVSWYAIPVESVLISPTADTVATGTPVQLTASVLPIAADDQTVTWSSLDESLAIVDEYGLVTTLASGTVTITATSVSNTDIKDSATIVIAQLFNASMAYDDENKYISTEYTVGDTMNVTLDYHAGTFNTVKDIKVWLRHMNSNWSVKKDYLGVIPKGVIGSESGTVTVPILTKGVTPTADLNSGEFYFLFTKFWFSDGGEADKGLNPINLVKAEEDNTSSYSISESENIRVFPNPTTYQLTIEVKNLTQQASISMFNINGKEVFSSTLSKNRQTINTSSYNAGIYFLRITDLDKTYTQKVVKQ